MPERSLPLRNPGDLARWLVQASPDGLWVFDENGLTVVANDRLAAMLGRAPEEMRGLSVFDCLDAQGKIEFGQHLDDLRANQTPGDNLECSLLRKDGERIWALVSHTSIRDDDGKHVGWMHRVTEYSQQRRLIDTLSRREHQLAEAQHIAKIGSWEWDVAADVVTWSDELYRIYEVDRADGLVPDYQAFLDHLHPDDRGRVADMISEAMATTGHFEFDARVVRRNGTTMWIRGRGKVTRDDSGAVIRMGGTSQDITETKDAEQALGLLTSMATAANEATSLSAVIPRALEDITEHTGWVPVDAFVVDDAGIPHRIEGPVFPVPEADHAEAHRLALASVASRTTEVSRSVAGTMLVSAPVVAEDRTACVIVMDTRSTTPPVDSDSATIAQATALFARVADREWTGERLARARDAAMQASHAKSEFLATMSHEIRTPLNGVIGLSELLIRTDLTPHQRRLADGIDGAGRTLLALVNDILDLSKIEAGRLDLETVDFDPRSVVEQSTTINAERARAKDLDLAVSCQPEVPKAVSGDPTRFGQVIANLTSNAVKFTAAGEVVVRATVESATEDGGTVLRVEVSDTGTGMSPEVQERLFTAFSQGDSSTTREYGGTGLGLAICRQIVTAMGGEIGVNSEPGQGSTFWFTAPFGPAADLTTTQAVHPSELAGLRVLVVDDNETNRFILEEQLAGWSIDASIASSGVHGLGLLDEASRSTTPFDVVLLDYLMPGVDGEQFARMVRGDGRFDQTRIILLSSVLELDTAALTEAGIDRWLTKPVLPSHLLECLAAVVSGPSLRPSGPTVPPVPARTQGPPPLPVGSRGNVLVVEDNPVNQMVAVGILESLGYAVSVADNGIAGVKAHAGAVEAFDAVLMDCQMPQMDGYDATRAIRAQEAGGPRTPIIAMTAAAVAGERERCLAAGMDDFLTKPVDVGLLREAMDRWVPQPSDAPPGDHPVDDTSQQPALDPATRAALDDLATEGVLDPARLEELLDLDPGDPSMLLRFIDRFGGNARSTLSDMRTAQSEGQAYELGRAAHSLKGSAANLGAAGLAETCRAVEYLGDDGVVTDAVGLARVERELERAVAALEAFGHRLRSGS